MYEQSRSRRSPVRYLAPLALAVMVIATYVVVEHALSSGTSASTITSTTGTATSPASSGGTKTRDKSKYYVVRSGDSLSVISARTGIALPTLESLNPGVSSNSLQVGQRLRLRR